METLEPPRRCHGIPFTIQTSLVIGCIMVKIRLESWVPAAMSIPSMYLNRPL